MKPRDPMWSHMEERQCQGVVVLEYSSVLQELIQKVGKACVSGRDNSLFLHCFSLKALMMSLEKAGKKTAHCRSDFSWGVLLGEKIIKSYRHYALAFFKFTM